MSLFGAFHRFFRAKKLDEIADYDSAEATDLDAEKIKKKAVLNCIYREKYHQMVEAMERHARTPEGLMLELGSGGGFFKEILPDLITSDRKSLSYVDRVVDAEKLPFDDGTLRCIFAMQVFHHIPSVRNFLKETVRCLKRGGVVVLMEPHDGPVARWFFGHLHPEPFRADASEWEFPPAGPASGSNQAMAYLVFKRDRAIFEKEFPDLEIAEIRADTFLEYLASGGVVYRQFLPDFAFSLLRLFDRVLGPFMRWIGLHQIIVLRRKGGGTRESG